MTHLKLKLNDLIMHLFFNMTRAGAVPTTDPLPNGVYQVGSSSNKEDEKQVVVVKNNHIYLDMDRELSLYEMLIFIFVWPFVKVVKSRRHESFTTAFNYGGLLRSISYSSIMMAIWLITAAPKLIYISDNAVNAIALAVYWLSVCTLATIWKLIIVYR